MKKKIILTIIMAAAIALTFAFALTACPASEQKDYAKVSFDTNGGVGTADTMKVSFDTNYGELPTVLKDGYAFAGWFTDNAAGEQITPDTMLKNKSDHTLFARWSKIKRNPISTGGGNGFTVCIDTDGNLWTWGTNQYGLGDGKTGLSTTPIRIAEETKFCAVSVAPRNYSYAIDVNGNMWAWGENGYGAFGDGTKINRPIPALTAEGTKFVDVSAGGLTLLEDGSVGITSLAIDASGNLWEINNGLWEVSDYFFGYEKFTAISANGNCRHAIDTDGNIWGWGGNGSPD